MKSIIAIAVIGICITAFTGCNVTQPETEIVARQSGLFTAVSWIASDGPSEQQIEKMVEILPVLTNAVTSVEEDKTYTEVIYPELVKHIDSKLPTQYRPLAKAGSGTILGAIDIMFALHPEWRENKDNASALVYCFIEGVQQGFELRESHPAVISARRTGALRTSALNW